MSDSVSKCILTGPNTFCSVALKRAVGVQLAVDKREKTKGLNEYEGVMSLQIKMYWLLSSIIDYSMSCRILNCI